MRGKVMVRAVSTVAIAMFLAVAPAAAQTQTASITNRDDRDHKVTIVEGDVTKDHVMKPNDTLKDICAKGCILRLNDSDDDEYQIEPTDVVSIEDGFLYYDTNEADPEANKDEPKKQ